MASLFFILFFNMNDKITCFYNSGCGGDSDSKDLKEKINSSIVTTSEAYNLVGFIFKGFW